MRRLLLALALLLAPSALAQTLDGQGRVPTNTELPDETTPADNESNAVNIPRIGAFMYIFDGATWDRWTGAVTQSGTWNIGSLTTFPDNEPFNVAQINGVTPLMGNGVTGTGSLRVTVASDNTAFTVNTGTFPDNEPFNVAQINGVTPLMGNGVTGTGSQRVTIASDNTAFTVNTGTFPDNEPFNVAQWVGVAPTAAAAAADNFSNPTFPPIGAFNMVWDGATWDRWPGTAADGGEVQVTVFPDNEPINQAQRGGVAVVAGACERETLLYIQINQVTGTQLITGTASERIYICAIQLMTATAQNIALVDGTGSVCATSPTGLLGGSTAATGWNFAANGGIVLPPTRDSWTKTSTDADNVCLLQSGAGQVSGSLTYISIPNI